MDRFSDRGSIPLASTNQKCVTGKVAKIPKYHVITVFRDFLLSWHHEKVRGLNVQMNVTSLCFMIAFVIMLPGTVFVESDTLSVKGSVKEPK